MASKADTGDSISQGIPTAFLDASVLMPAAISSRGSSRDLIEAGQRGLTYDRRHLLGEAVLIRREYGIDVVTPDHVVARPGEL